MKKTKFLDKKRLMKNTTSAISILIALFLVISSAVSAIQPDSETERFIEPAFASNAHTSVICVASESSGQNTETGNLVDFLGYDDGYTESAWRYTEGEPWSHAIQLTDALLAPYRDYEITEVMFSCGDDVYGFAIADYEIWISDQLEDPTAPPVVYGTGTSSGTGWDIVPLDMPYDIPDTGDVYLGITYSNYPATDYPAGVDHDNYLPEGFWFYYGAVWQDASGVLGQYAVWGLDAGVTPGGPGPEHDIAVLGINEPNTGPAAESIPVEVKVKNTGNNSETNVPIQMIINKITGTTVYTVYEEDFEADDGGYTVTGDLWEWGTPTDPNGPASAHSGSYCWGTDLDYDYGDYQDAKLDSILIVDLPLAATLKFWHWYDTEANYDGCKVKISNDGGSTFNLLGYYTGPGQGYWEEVEFDLGTYAGDDVIIRWHFESDSSVGWYPGWFIDLVTITFEDYTFEEQYNEIEEVDLAIGEVLDVPFPDFEPWDWQNIENDDVEYVTEATAMLPGDENPDNDEKETAFTLSYPFLHDIEVTSINAPPLRGTPAQTLDVEVTIENVGQYTECCYKTNVQIGQELVTTYIGEDFEGGVPPAGWTVTYDPGCFYSWMNNIYSNGAGSGICAEANSDYWYSYTGGDLITPQFSLATETSAALDFELYFVGYVDDFRVDVYDQSSGLWVTEYALSGTTYYGHVQIDLTPYCGNSVVQVRFHYDDNGYWGYYCQVDDVEIKGEPQVIAEYDEDVCTITLDPGESADLTFPQWTPDDLSNYGFEGSIEYIVAAEQQLPGDTNPANDKVTEALTLDYWQDVGIQEITSPAIGGKQPTWIQYSDETIENALGLTGPGIICEAIKLTPDELGTYTNHEITQIRVCKGYPGYEFIHDYEVWMYTGAQPTDPDAGTVVATGTSPQAHGWFEIDTDDYAFDPTDTVWIGVTWDHPSAGTYPISLDDSIVIPGKSDWYTYDVGSGWISWLEYGTYSMMLGVGVEEGGAPGPPDADIFIPKGSQPIGAIVENLGTYEETGLTCTAEIYEYVSDPLNGTELWNASIPDIALDPLGGEEPLAFGSYNFQLEGIHALDIHLPLTGDNDDTNNDVRLGIGVDDTAPTSDHTIDPVTPDGENGWYVSDVTVSFTADDGTEPWQSGVDYIEYRVDGSSWQTGDSVTVTTDKDDHVVEYRAVDNVGNVGTTNSVTFDLDKTAPTVDLTWEATGGNEIVFTATCSDLTSGMDRVEFAMNDVVAFTDDADPFEWIIEWSPSMATIMFKATAYDVAGNSAFEEIPGYEAVSQSQSTQQSQQSPVVRQTNFL